MRIKRVACEYGDFRKNHFGEPVIGDLFLGVPVKWAFLFPKNEMPALPFLGTSVFGDFPKSDTAILGISCHMPEYL